MTAATPPLLYDPVDQIRSAGTTFARLVREGDLDAAVASCGDWKLRDLAFHVGSVWGFWAGVVANGVADVADVRTLERPTQPGDEGLADFVGGQLEVLCAALSSAPSEQRIWTWTGANRSTDWVRRRMTQETVVHLWDAARAVGDAYEVPAAVAADGIDEFLMWFAATDRREGEMKVGGTVHLHCTDDALPDGHGEWFVSAMKEPTATFTREHRKGDVAVRGRAHDILMWLWRRDAGAVDIVGDDVVARRFQAFTDLI